MAARPLRLVSTPLEVFSGSRESEAATSHNIPSRYPHIGSSNQSAIAAGCYTDDVLALISTPLADQCILELRTLFLHSSQANPAPQQLLFPAPILETVHLSANSNDTLLLQACTLSGIIYRILLPLDLLGNVDEIPARWISEYKIGSLGSDPLDIFENRLLTAFHTSQDGCLSLAACVDGRVIKVVWEEEKEGRSSEGRSGSWHESTLRPDTFFSRLFSRPGSSASPAQTLSMSTYSRSSLWKHTLGFTASRDRKLRIWDLGSDACIRIIDLPTLPDSKRGEEVESVAIADASSNEEGASGGATLFSTVPVLQTYAVADALFVLVYIPAPLPSGNFIACYRVHFEGPALHSNRVGAANLGRIELVWEKRCDKETRGWNVELRDLAVVAQSGEEWDVWCVWDAAGRTLVKRIEGLAATDARWDNISAPQSYSSLHGLSLDEDLKAVSKVEDLAEFFMRRIVEPGRFSRGSLEGALKEYEGMLMDDRGMLPSMATTSASDSVKEQICDLVGCGVELQQEETTGTLLHERYWAAIRKEWSTFVSLVEDQEARERWPIGFVKGKEEKEEPFIVSRRRLSLAVMEDRSSGLLRAVQYGAREGEGETQAEVIEVLTFAHKFLHSIHPAALHSFETELLKALETQSSSPPENVADLLWTSHLQGSLDDEELLEEEFVLMGGEVKEAVVEALAAIQHSSSPTTRRPVSPILTELDAALCSDAMTQVSSDRLALVRSLNVLAFALCVGHLPLEGDAVEGGPAIEDVVGEVCATYHRLYSFDVLARRDGTMETIDAEPKADEGGAPDPNAVADEMENMRFDNEEGETGDAKSSATATNLVHACILRRRLGLGLSLSADSASDRIYHFSIAALEGLLFASGQGLQPIEMTSSLARFANEVVKLGYPSAAAAFVELYPRSPASFYLLARSLILCNKTEEAAAMFDRVTPAFYRLEEEHSEHGSGLMDMLSPPIKRAKSTTEALFCYHRRVVSYFQQRVSHSHYFIAHFAKKAIDCASRLSSCDTRPLQEICFRSLLALEWYEDAYSHLLAVPFLDLQKDLLPDLISRMCEQGQVDLLLSLNFASLQLEVSSTLSFKARNSKTMSEIEFYFDLLYAFYVKRGDFKNAGATMWQMGTRLRHLAKVVQSGRGQEWEDEDEEMRKLSILEARCYLASINVLSQLDPQDAWFAHDAAGAEDEEGMESKLTNYVPASAFRGKGKETLRIVYLVDIRRRYQIRLAQLELFATRPLYSTSILTTDRNDANSVVSLFTSNDDFERAFTLARLLQVNRTQVYSTLTDRCLELTDWEQGRSAGQESGQGEHPLIQSLLDDQEGPEEGYEGDEAGFLSRIDRCTTWSGSTAQRGWRYLRLWLDAEDDEDDGGAKYHLIVLNRILYWQRYSSTPDWLIDWLRINQVEHLVKSLLSHDLLKEALAESVKMVSAATQVVTRKRKRSTSLSMQIYLPYLLLDELLKRAEEKVATTSTEGIATGMLVERRKLAKELRDAIESHKDRLQKVEAQTRRELDEDARREKRFNLRYEGDVVMG